MDPVTLFLIPGFAGGVAIALLLIRLNPRSASKVATDPLRREPLTTDFINIASIRVAGIGGLGLVAMAVAVALLVPRIGETLAVGFVLGAVFGAILIVRRHRTGPIASSGQRAGANTTLSIDVPPDDAPRPSPPIVR